LPVILFCVVGINFNFQRGVTNYTLYGYVYLIFKFYVGFKVYFGGSAFSLRNTMMPIGE